TDSIRTLSLKRKPEPRKEDEAGRNEGLLVVWSPIVSGVSEVFGSERKNEEGSEVGFSVGFQFMVTRSMVGVIVGWCWVNGGEEVRRRVCAMGRREREGEEERAAPLEKEEGSAALSVSAASGEEVGEGGL
ncbi:hypothetical protein HAX54_009153, partial [Datura stramonium]|nr:hypothetical protein [Datura stramonium]